MADKRSPDRTPLACVILAAGLGTRMKSDLPKVLHPVANVPMIRHVLLACAELLPERLAIVIGPKTEAVAQAVAPHKCVVQAEPRGTGDAAKAAREELKGFAGDMIVLFGDTPLVTADSLRALQAKRKETKAAIVVAGFHAQDPAAYGRLILDGDKLTAIVEAADATPAQRKIDLCNGGIMLFDGGKMWQFLDALKPDNAKKEFYLTDCVKLAAKAGETCAVAEMPEEEALGINTRVELAAAEKLMQQRLRRKAMLDGATLSDPDTVYLSADAKIGRDVSIGPGVIIGPGVEIANKAEIRAFCHLEQSRIEEGAVIGPFARLRPGCVVGEGAHIGNFVEIKKTEVGAGAKINHLSYMGDATVGAKANIGAGTITCNYDGYRKYRTEIGAGTFVGSNTALVAPVKVGEGAYIGAGSTITMEVPAHTLAVARGRQANIEEWVQKFHARQNAERGK
ncbi:MAG TPA: bifunctional UDP-N-acetylglucosamine diphosphorylase/glucosamine-1-phosphate N-acetyltransferase GlmU [Alphaproteobacteria bacterium]|nr:bifunctional UDP-N-acetylglucosamine diphosphorylase/glucosamine-1-phosphate N-acetyltransferase GlmU [Alphaproteobacteria bacterium]